MKVKIRTQYLLEGLENRYETLQKILKHNFGISESNDEVSVLCDSMKCDDCKYFNEDYPCATQQVLELLHLITILRKSNDQYAEIKIEETRN